ncbi:hypothetical protein [Paraliobacillus ryukyuensis]|uniref:hypothetical protein n=1 Tax=Paraliobacillus ryukyuensis TaxID=200904 RepID=UPI0009A8F6DE|nr:hypothetical protein [Paraliobacillus ryukyuensis]
MNSRDHLMEIYKKFQTSEDLLRLLYYYPTDNNGNYSNPLSQDKQNILDMSPLEKLNIIKDRIRFTKSIDGMGTDENHICRIIFYAGRRSVTSNRLTMNQDINFDIIVHREFNDNDMRLEWIKDVVDKILVYEDYSSFGEVKQLSGKEISGLPEGYIGYQLTYNFGDLIDK